MLVAVFEIKIVRESKLNLVLLAYKHIDELSRFGDSHGCVGETEAIAKTAHVKKQLGLSQQAFRPSSHLYGNQRKNTSDQS